MIFGQTTIPAGWETYGILGLVITSLLSGLGFLYRDKVKREREIDTRHTTERAEWAQKCREERETITTIHRQAWEEARADTRASNDRLATIVGELTGAIRDLHIDVKARRMEETRREQSGGNS